MRKLALAGIVSILAMVALSGCLSVPKEEDTTTPADETTQVVEDVQEETDVAEDLTEMKTYTGTALPLQFEYPSNMQIEISDRELPQGAYYITLGEEKNESGYLLPLVRISVEKDDYQEVMAEIADGPFFPIGNKCEDENWADLVMSCKTEGDWTTFLAIGHMGDLSFEKTYFMDKEATGWSKAEVGVDLLTDKLFDELNKVEDFTKKDQFIKDYTLDTEQLRRIELADALVASLTLK